MPETRIGPRVLAPVGAILVFASLQCTACSGKSATLVSAASDAGASSQQDAVAAPPPSGAPGVGDAAPASDAPIAETGPGTTPVEASTGPSAPVPSPRQLPIPPRVQWNNSNGYCGETSIQSIALYYGTWASEELIRTLAGGTQVLVGTNSPEVLSALQLTFVEWDNSVPEPQFQGFFVWLKGNLALGYPAYFGAYLTDGNDDPDYDHIMPATGIAYKSLTTYDPADVLTYNDNFGDQIMRPASMLSATRVSCAYSSTQGGCIPQNVDYGIAVTGVVDPQHVTFPVSLSVASSSEPNVSMGASPVAMTGTVTVSGLSAGGTYSLLRYDDYTMVPMGGSTAAFASSGFTHKTDFTATGSTWSLVDSDTFPSDASSTYRCIQSP